MTVAAEPFDFERPAPSNANGAAHVDEWDAPEPLDAITLPAFPVEALSSPLRDWAMAEAAFCQVPVDLPAAVALSTGSLCAARLFRVQVRPGWTEPTNIWTATALNPAERKSPVFVEGTAPVYEYGAAEGERLAPTIKDRDRERRVIAEQIKCAEAAASKGKPYQGQDALQAAHELDALLSGRPELRAPKLITDDVTAEALAKVLAENLESMALFSSEGGPFEVLAGRYSDGPNIELHLKSHTGDPHVVDRISRAPIVLRSPLLVVCLTVQPIVIQGLASKPTFRGRGLLARYLYSLPQTALGTRTVDSPEVPTAVRAAYRAAISNLLRAFDPAKAEKRTLTLDDAADRERAAYQTRLEPRLGEAGDLAPLADWAGKLVGTACRLAGILHAADHAQDLANITAEIPIATFVRATAIADYYLEHAVAAFSAMGADKATELARRIWKWIARGRRADFTQDDARRATHSKSDEMPAALDLLCERSLVRELPPPPKPPQGGRPPSPTYAVNPRAMQ